MANYYIGIGGTGARCAEAFIYLAAAGIIKGDMQLLIIDPDANNGNSSAVENLLTYYTTISREGQPRNPNSPRTFKILSSILPAKPRDPVLFQVGVNNDGAVPGLWNMPQTNERQFIDVVEYAACSQKLKSFVDLFYQTEDLDMRLGVGYQGRTNVGAVALKEDLEETRDRERGGLREFLVALTRDLQNGEARVFVTGSVFGGTGAAGIPTLPALLKGLGEQDLPANQRANLRWGCAMMGPYFIFPRPSAAEAAHLGLGTDSTLHPIATQAALMHYAHTPPAYQHVYLIGAPFRGQTNDANHPGGSDQRNQPHYAELAAALAAWDFFSLQSTDREEKKLHFADTQDNGIDRGVTWETLPVGVVGAPGRRGELAQKLIAFTTFVYVYRNILHNEFITNQSYRDSDMYKDNFGTLSLEGYAQEQSLVALNAFCDNYLGWLRGISQTGGEAVRSLFNWQAFEARDVSSCELLVGNLVALGTPEAPRLPNYSRTGYQKIMEILNRTKLDSPQTQSPVGLLIYLLYAAVYEFCRQNYGWPKK